MYIKKPALVHIPDAYIGGFKKRSQWGKVISWGSKCHYNYKQGDRVFFKWESDRIGVKIDDQDIRFVREHELLAKDEDA